MKNKLSNHTRSIVFAFDDKDRQDQIRKISYLIKEMENFISSISSDWDCDVDAHRYNTQCRCCEAQKLMAKLEDFN